RDDLVTGVQTCALPIYRFPLYIRAKSRQKHRHFRRQSAPANVDVMPHLVNQDQHSKAQPEFPSPQNEVQPQECKEAEEKFELKEIGRASCREKEQKQER